MENENAFKNWINPTVVKKISLILKKHYTKFNQKRFEKIIPKLKELELKNRVLLLTDGIRKELPGNFNVDAKILKKVLLEKKLKSFELWPISEYISQFGTEHFEESFDLMYLLTSEFTSEFAIRTFLQKDPKRVLIKMKTWLKDENVHIRRWISEGTRPLLPWGGKILYFIENPITIELLDHLKYDEELYVRKSIANHLNDISKHHPYLVIKTLQKWIVQCPENHLEKINWIKKQALRTLIKKGDPKALSLMGVSGTNKIKLSQLKLNARQFNLGDTLEFEFILKSTSTTPQKLIIDYGIGFLKANGTTSTKIFKLKTLELKAKEEILIKKKHSLKKITTMTFYPGKHQLILQINGKILHQTNWTMKI